VDRRGYRLARHRTGQRVTYPGKARKAIYRDADANEIGFGGASIEQGH